MDILGTSSDPDVRVDGAALLCEARHVEDRDALPLDVRGHAEERADRHDTRAADPGDEDAVGTVEGGE